MKPKIRESLVLRACLHYLATLGIEAWRTNSGMVMVGEGKGRRPLRFGKKGLPDILGYLPGGQALFIECKGTGGKLRPEQEAFLDRARRAGCLCIVAYSIDDVAYALKGETK